MGVDMKTVLIVTAWTCFLGTLATTVWALFKVIQAGHFNTGEEPFFMVTAVGFFALAAVFAVVADTLEQGD